MVIPDESCFFFFWRKWLLFQCYIKYFGNKPCLFSTNKKIRKTEFWLIARVIIESWRKKILLCFPLVFMPRRDICKAAARSTLPGSGFAFKGSTQVWAGCQHSVNDSPPSSVFWPLVTKRPGTQGPKHWNMEKKESDLKHTSELPVCLPRNPGAAVPRDGWA